MRWVMLGTLVVIAVLFGIRIVQELDRPDPPARPARVIEYCYPDSTGKIDQEACDQQRRGRVDTECDAGASTVLAITSYRTSGSTYREFLRLERTIVC